MAADGPGKPVAAPSARSPRAARRTAAGDPLTRFHLLALAEGLAGTPARSKLGIGARVNAWARFRQMQACASRFNPSNVPSCTVRTRAVAAYDGPPDGTGGRRHAKGERPQETALRPPSDVRGSPDKSAVRERLCYIKSPTPVASGGRERSAYRVVIRSGEGRPGPMLSQRERASGPQNQPHIPVLRCR